MAPTNQHARVRRTASTRRQRELAKRRPAPAPVARPPLDPRSFLARLKRRIAAGSVVTFGAFFGLATMNVVGVTSLGSSQGGTQPAATTAPVLPPGDFFGQPGAPIVAAPVNQPQVILGGGPPMLTSGGS